MVLYGIGLLPLGESLQQTAPQVLQPWYADDFGMLGQPADVAPVMHQLMTEGPPRGYFPEPAKSIVVCTESAETAARAAFTDFHFKYCHGAHYVGGFIGTQHKLDMWLQPKIDGWVSGVKTLVRVATRYPQTSFAGLRLSLQNE